MAAKRLIVITVPLKNGDGHKGPAIARSSANPNFSTNPKIPIPQICVPKTAVPNTFKISAPIPHFTPPTQKVYKHQSSNNMTIGGGWKRAYSHHDEEDNNLFIDQASYGGDSGDDMLDEIRPPRKRQRLTHLSPEEKVNRRKMKNRIAAHVARERRKNFMQELEQKYKRLRYENDGLKSRNEQFRVEIHRLSDENKDIKHQIELLRQESLANKVNVVNGTSSPAAIQNVAQTVECTTVGSAAGASHAHQPAGQVDNGGADSHAQLPVELVVGHHDDDTERQLLQLLPRFVTKYNNGGSDPAAEIGNFQREGSSNAARLARDCKRVQHDGIEEPSVTVDVESVCEAAGLPEQSASIATLTRKQESEFDILPPNLSPTAHTSFVLPYSAPAHHHNSLPTTVNFSSTASSSSSSTSIFNPVVSESPTFSAQMSFDSLMSDASDSFLSDVFSKDHRVVKTCPGDQLVENVDNKALEEFLLFDEITRDFGLEKFEDGELDCPDFLTIDNFNSLLQLRTF